MSRPPIPYCWHLWRNVLLICWQGKTQIQAQATYSSVTSSSWRTFALTAPAMQVLCGMLSSLSLWFRKVIKSRTAGHSTNWKGWKVSLPNPAWAWRKCWLTKSQVVIIASRCSWIPSLVTGGIWAGFVTFWPYFAMDCWTSWDVLTKVSVKCPYYPLKTYSWLVSRLLGGTQPSGGIQFAGRVGLKPFLRQVFQ